MLKIALIPIDNRPVCYTLPRDIVNFCSEVEICLPPRELLGGLSSVARIDEILLWLEELSSVDVLVVSLDTIAYGGLVASRRSCEDIKIIQNRINKLKKIIKQKNINTYAFSSIMRISNNNVNEEEKEYWNIWGKKIFDYSFNLHKSQKIKSYDSNAKFSCIRQIIPTEILDDYFSTRKRNFEINKFYLELQKDGIFKYLVFSKDDCAQYGVNVAEAEEIQEKILAENLNAIVKTGADEIPLSLLSRALCDYKKSSIKIYPRFLRPDEINLISKYEDVSIWESVRGQIELCGGIVASSEEVADLILIINNFSKEQGELVMNISTEPFSGDFSFPNKPFSIIDVVFANGADNQFVKKLFEKQICIDNYCGFAAWNTSANSLGSAICAALFKLQCEVNVEAFKQQQFIRFVDDWAYQSNCRNLLKEHCANPDCVEIERLMAPYINKIEEFLTIKQKKICYQFPWNRFFEIELTLED